jgi:hypothetical protein
VDGRAPSRSASPERPRSPQQPPSQPSVNNGSSSQMATASRMATFPSPTNARKTHPWPRSRTLTRLGGSRPGRSIARLPPKRRLPQQTGRPNDGPQIRRGNLRRGSLLNSFQAIAKRRPHVGFQTSKKARRKTPVQIRYTDSEIRVPPMQRTLRPNPDPPPVLDRPTPLVPIASVTATFLAVP